MPRYFKREGRGKGYEDVTREVAALRAEVASWRATAADKGIAARAIAEERDALRAERDALNEEANALSREATRLAAELRRVTTERDAYRDELYECQRERDSWNIDVMHMRPVVEAAEAQTNRIDIEGMPPCTCICMRCDNVEDAVDAYRLATSEQERCECVPAVDEDGAPDGYEYVCNLHEKASEREASDAPA